MAVKSVRKRRRLLKQLALDEVTEVARDVAPIADPFAAAVANAARERLALIPKEDREFALTRSEEQHV